MLVDAQGRPLAKPKQKTVTATAVIFISEDFGESWHPVKAYNLPVWLNDLDVMGCMFDGEIVSEHESGPFYRLARIEEESAIH